MAWILLLCMALIGVFGSLAKASLEADNLISFIIFLVLTIGLYTYTAYTILDLLVRAANG